MDFQKFFHLCNPACTLDLSNPEDRQYYIDFSSVRGKDIIRKLARTITDLSPNQPTCQLFSGHIGCGKSTELLRLKANLEKQGFYVVYFESTQDLDMMDVDVTDILLAIARQVSESLEHQQIYLQPRGFKELLGRAVEFLQAIDLTAEIPIPGGGNLEFSLPTSIANITAKAKDAPNLRSRLRQYLEPRTNNILQVINEELLDPATKILRENGRKGIVVIVDNLDRVNAREMPSKRLQTEYIFIDRGEQLRQLNCHLVYTVPLVLLFSNDAEQMKNRLGGGIPPKILPMAPVQRRHGQIHQAGLALMRQMLLVRAFPELEAKERLNYIDQVFDAPETLDRLCYISGGHMRHFLSFFYSCLQETDLPVSRDTLEGVIQEHRDTLVSRVDDFEWDLIFQVIEQQSLKGEKEYQTLLSSMFLFEYRDESGRWFGINPVLAEASKFKQRQAAKLRKTA
ncbi:MAG: ATP-binding protein [Pseudanabaenales cyanobacterium]|nr:ATP-binding protein [Pseudanabaenales cyanobacterium]